MGAIDGRCYAMILVVLALAACTAGRIDGVPEASRVRVGSQAPSGDIDQLGAITAQHGGGCGLYGARGTYEGAFAVLRNKAAQIGADYVQILRVKEPRLEGACMNQAFVIDGMAYKLGRPRAGTTSTQPGLNGTYEGTVNGSQDGQPFAIRITFTLVQTGDRVIGTWNTTGGTTGTVTARVEDGRMQFRARQINPCEADFEGAAVIEGDSVRLRGNYAGNGCGAAIAASFVVARQ